MNLVKKYVGLFCMILAPVIVFFLFKAAITHIDPSGTKDFNKPAPWIIIIAVFTPIAAGLLIFGWYAFKGEYKHLPENSDEL
jgi:hypothetical protein